MRKETVATSDLGVLTEKSMEPITIIIRPLIKIRKTNQFIQFKWTFSPKSIYITNLDWLHFHNKSSLKRSHKCRTCNPSFLFLQLTHHIQVAFISSILDMTPIFHARIDGRFTEIKYILSRRICHRTNESSHFLWGSFQDRSNIRISIRFSENDNPILLKDEFLNRGQTYLSF